MRLQPNLQDTCTIALSMHGVNIFLLGQRSRSQGQKQHFFLRFVSGQIQLNKDIFFNDINTKHVSYDGYSTRAKERS